MFLVRSAFWLTVAFIAFHPKDIDLGATANALSGQAVAAGQQIVVAEVLKHDCLLNCGTSAAPTTTASLAVPSETAATQISSPARRAPYPRPRPAWMG
jgi:hypothetical protein